MDKGKTTEKVLDNVTRSKVCLYHVALVFLPTTNTMPQTPVNIHGELALRLPAN